MTHASTTGNSSPLGVTLTRGGANFSVYSRDATGIELLFFDHEDSVRPARVISLDPCTNRTYHYWHVFVPDVRPGQIYAYRAEGPSARPKVFASMRPRFCSIHTAAASSFLRTTAGMPPAMPGTIRLRHEEHGR